MATIIPRLLEVCQQEWEFFDRSNIKLDGTSHVGKREYDDGAWQRIGDYWKFVGGGYQHLTGKDRGTPWSAAFVSWAMHEAGAKNRFPYSAGHSKYINEAIRNADNGVATASIIGHRLAGYKLKPGDLLGYWRGDTKITFENARAIGWYASHTDVVVEVGDKVAYSIGGNVLHSVTRRAVKLNANGELADKSANWFVVVENAL